MIDQKEFDIKQGKLIKYLGNSENVAIPEGITDVGDEAFFKNIVLKSIEIPEGVKRIGQCAFGYCENLTDIIMGSNIKYIGIGTFRSCPKLTLHAPAGSYVEANAKENNLPFAAI